GFGSAHAVHFTLPARARAGSVTVTRGSPPLRMGAHAQDRPSTRSFGVVPRRLGDELVEEPRVVAGLRVPEDAHGERPIRVLERLDGTVVRAGGDAKTVADTAEALVVVRLHARPLAKQPPDLRIRGE